MHCDHESIHFVVFFHIQKWIIINIAEVVYTRSNGRAMLATRLLLFIILLTPLSSTICSLQEEDDGRRILINICTCSHQSERKSKYKETQVYVSVLKKRE